MLICDAAAELPLISGRVAPTNRSDVLCHWLCLPIPAAALLHFPAVEADAGEAAEWARMAFNSVSAMMAIPLSLGWP